MSKIIDIKTKKEIPDFKKISYLERTMLCYERAKVTSNKKCDCVYCQNKDILAIKLATISQWLVTDHNDKTKLDLCWADWFDISVMSATKVQDIVYPHLKK